MPAALVEHCIVCGAVVHAAAVALDIPFVAQKFYLCDVHAKDLVRTGLSVGNFLAGRGLQPAVVARIIDGARGLARVARAVRGK